MKNANKARLGVFGAVVSLMVALSGGTALAEPADPAGDLTTEFQSGAESFITSDGAPMIIALFVLAAVFGVGLRWATKGKRAAAST